MTIKLSKAQLMQLKDIVRATRITRGVNKGQRKAGENYNFTHFDMRSFNSLIQNGLVKIAEYDHDECFATDSGYEVWLQNTQSKNN
ncbi:conserved hypothetical protein [Vibrio chagasii]|uniref:hypothetical protein n=1 Tax=Vibrio fortis TaxID=212667 RepID=UPI00336DE743|nr:conserved hypothetical protein [Vibrio chagasii]CAH7222786.1 conserved hypothetical protein [Vibrio chagasii]